MFDAGLYANCDNTLKEVLLEMPQFRKKEDLIQMYVAYEFPQEQSYLLHFWDHAIKHVMKKHFRQVSVPITQIKQCFVLNHFEPACFYQVLRELIEKRHFILAEYLDTPETYKELGLQYTKEIPKQSLFMTLSGYLNPMNIFNKKAEMPLLTSKLIDITALKENLKTAVSRFSEVFKDKTIASEDELDNFFANELKYSKQDIQLYKDLLVNGEVLKKEVVEIGRKRYHIFVYNPLKLDVAIEKTAFILQSSIQYYEKRIEEFEAQAEQSHQEAAKAVLKKNKDQAKMYLKRQKMLQETAKQYLDKKYLCEEHLIKIETSSSNKDIVSLLQYVRAAHDELKINPDEMFDIAQSMKEMAEERKETGMIIEKMANENDVDDEYAMLERQILGESVPLQEPKIISQPQVRNREPLQEEHENAENDENSMHIEQLLQ